MIGGGPAETTENEFVAPLMAPKLAPMAVAPVPIAVARPELLMVVTAGLKDIHAAEDVKSCVEPSE
jgi:hypothetical protein